MSQASRPGDFGNLKQALSFRRRQRPSVVERNYQRLCPVWIKSGGCPVRHGNRGPAVRVHRSCNNRASSPVSADSPCMTESQSSGSTRGGYRRSYSRISIVQRNTQSSCPVHHAIAILYRLGLRGDLMLVHHVPSPVVFPGERLAALSRIGASVFGAVELAGLLVLIVDMAI